MRSGPRPAPNRANSPGGRLAAPQFRFPRKRGTPLALGRAIVRSFSRAGDYSMSALNREEFIELGVSIPTSFVTEWASGQVAATKGRESRLEMRGVNAA